MKAVHNARRRIPSSKSLVIAHVKLQNESSSQLVAYFEAEKKPCDCSRKITK